MGLWVMTRNEAESSVANYADARKRLISIDIGRYWMIKLKLK
jgi:hypothetical protein